MNQNKPQWIIAGLGNPGEDYKLNRHNAGFLCIDRLAEKYNISFDFQEFDALCGFGVIEGQRCVLVKPQTFMNLSGTAISGFVDLYELPLENLLVISDDISFDVGKMRCRRNGSAGGQNGLKNIIENVGGQDFPRIKIGVGKKPEGCDLADWVLSDFTEEDFKVLDTVFENACNAIPLIINGEMDTAMGKFN